MKHIIPSFWLWIVVNLQNFSKAESESLDGALQNNSSSASTSRTLFLSPSTNDSVGLGNEQGQDPYLSYYYYNLDVGDETAKLNHTAATSPPEFVETAESDPRKQRMKTRKREKRRKRKPRRSRMPSLVEMLASPLRIMFRGRRDRRQSEEEDVDEENDNESEFKFNPDYNYHPLTTTARDENKNDRRQQNYWSESSQSRRPNFQYDDYVPYSYYNQEIRTPTPYSYDTTYSTFPGTSKYNQEDMRPRQRYIPDMGNLGGGGGGMMIDPLADDNIFRLREMFKKMKMTKPGNANNGNTESNLQKQGTRYHPKSIYDKLPSSEYHVKSIPLSAPPNHPMRFMRPPSPPQKRPNYYQYFDKYGDVHEVQIKYEDPHDWYTTDPTKGFQGEIGPLTQKSIPYSPKRTYLGWPGSGSEPTYAHSSPPVSSPLKLPYNPFLGLPKIKPTIIKISAKVPVPGYIIAGPFQSPPPRSPVPNNNIDHHYSPSFQEAREYKDGNNEETVVEAVALEDEYEEGPENYFSEGPNTNPFRPPQIIYGNWNPILDNGIEQERTVAGAVQEEELFHEVS